MYLYSTNNNTMSKYIKIPLVGFKFLGAVEAVEQVTCSADVVRALRQAWKDDIHGVESFYVVCLTRANKIININCVSKGSRSATIADPKIVFLHAIKSQASSIIIAHNHPSGQLTPSQEDIRVTGKMVKGGAYLDIHVHDHIIVTADDYYSFADHGTLHS